MHERVDVWGVGGGGDFCEGTSLRWFSRWLLGVWRVINKAAANRWQSERPPGIWTTAEKMSGGGVGDEHDSVKHQSMKKDA